MQHRAWTLAAKTALLALLSYPLGCGSGSGGARDGGSAGASSGGGGAGGQSTSSGGSQVTVLPTGGSGASGAGGSSGAGGTSSANGGSSAGSSGANGSSSGQAGSTGLPSGPAVVYVGGFGSDPVLAYDLNTATGALSPLGGPIDAGPEPSCFAVDPARKHLYVCNEDDRGGLTSFAIDAQGSLTRLNQRSGRDAGFTSLAVHPSGQWIAGASYSGGSASLFALLPDGSVGEEADTAGFGQEAQSHCVTYDPAGKFLLVPTKGADQVQQLIIGEGGALVPNQPASVATATSAGPRHLAVHPNGKHAYLINERGSSVTTFQLSSDGKLTPSATVSSVPAGFAGQNTGAHVELTPNAAFLYVSNRGHDSIGAFAIDATTGALTLLEHEPSRGSAPHDFDIDERGEILAAINRKSSTLALFRIGVDGSLSALGEPVATRADPTAVLIHYPR